MREFDSKLKHEKTSKPTGLRKKFPYYQHSLGDTQRQRMGRKEFAICGLDFDSIRIY